MECRKIQEMLTSYLEGAVTPEQEQLVRDHLSSCERCRCSLEDLQKTGTLVKDLEEIEPPPWLTQKIMARVRDEAEHKSAALRRFFYPLHVKLPLQAFATILIVGFAVFLYKVNAPRYEAPKVAPGAGAVLKKDDLRTPASPEGPRRANDAETKHEEVKQETAKQFAAEKKRPRKGSIGADRIAEAPAAVSGSVARMKSERFSITVRVEDVADAAKKVEKLLEQEGAQQVTRESREGRESLSAELKGEKVKGLLQKLSGLGETHGSTSDTQAGETVAIRIDLFETAKQDEGHK
ncbi:MAG: hypothetical protein CVU64_15125 [Deltaproteobacteria bacterium HGW-Deltaproteobacteria-21]|nr:MAG: hypothetical protein CVU64_15125 [Deltaproteobacteria bacterium HGW-Deltaproteobacteria-21]